MQSITYTNASRQNDRLLPARGERRVSLTKAGMILANFALWAVMIGSVVMAAR